VDFDPKTKVLRSIFWSHASQRAEYKDFGDVITFDTTHKTNRKNMPLGMFVGANNNLKNVSFGQALLQDETTESFKWLFETFKNCNGGEGAPALCETFTPIAHIMYSWFANLIIEQMQ